MKNDDARYERGAAKMQELFGPEAGAAVGVLAANNPALAQHLVKFPFGDIYSRPGFDSKTREMLTVTALVVIGFAQEELKEHIRAALRVGCTQDDIAEIILQMAIYAGFPAALQATKTAAIVFEEE